MRGLPRGQPGDTGVVGEVDQPVDEGKDSSGSCNPRPSSQKLEIRADRSTEVCPGVLGVKRWNDSLEAQVGLCSPGPLPSGGGLPGSLACGQHQEETGAADNKPSRDRRVRRTRSQASSKSTLSGDQRLARVRTAIGAYNREVTDLSRDEVKMYDLQHQLEIARTCILKIENLVQLRR